MRLRDRPTSPTNGNGEKIKADALPAAPTVNAVPLFAWNTGEEQRTKKNKNKQRTTTKTIQVSRVKTRLLFIFTFFFVVLFLLYFIFWPLAGHHET